MKKDPPQLFPSAHKLFYRCGDWSLWKVTWQKSKCELVAEDFIGDFWSLWWVCYITDYKQRDPIIKWRTWLYLLCQLLLEIGWMSPSFCKSNWRLISFCLFFLSWFLVKVLCPRCNIISVMSLWINSMS